MTVVWITAGIGALLGAGIGLAVGVAANSYVLSVIDWAKQDYFAGGYTSPAILAALGAFTGFFLGLIFKASR